MKDLAGVRYPSSANLFQFCRKVLDHKFGGVRVIDQDVGQILGFDPADCSHWKKGKKNIRSIQAMKSIADHLGLDERLVVDIATGELDETEGFMEYYGYGAFRLDGKTCDAIKKDYYKRHASQWSKDREAELKIIFTANEQAIDAIVTRIHGTIDFQEAPLYMPELLAAYPSVKLEPIEDRKVFADMAIPVQYDLSPDQITVRFPAGMETKPYMRFQISKALGEFFLQGEEFKSLNDTSEFSSEIRDVQCNLFAAKLLTPAKLVRQEINQVNVAKDVIGQLAEIFWVSKTFMNRRLKEVLQASGDL